MIDVYMYFLMLIEITQIVVFWVFYKNSRNKYHKSDDIKFAGWRISFIPVKGGFRAEATKGEESIRTDVTYYTKVLATTQMLELIETLQSKNTYARNVLSQIVLDDWEGA